MSTFRDVLANHDLHISCREPVLDPSPSLWCPLLPRRHRLRGQRDDRKLPNQDMLDQPRQVRLGLAEFPEESLRRAIVVHQPLWPPPGWESGRRHGLRQADDHIGPVAEIPVDPRPLAALAAPPLRLIGPDALPPLSPASVQDDLGPGISSEVILQMAPEVGAVPRHDDDAGVMRSDP